MVISKNAMLHKETQNEKWICWHEILQQANKSIFLETVISNGMIE